MGAEQTTETARWGTELEVYIPSAREAVEWADCRWIDRLCLPADGERSDLPPDRTVLRIDDPDAESAEQTFLRADALEFQAKDLTLVLRYRATHPRKLYVVTLPSESWESVLLRVAPRVRAQASGFRVSLASPDLEMAIRLAETAMSVGIPWRFVWQVSDRERDLIGWCGFLGELARFSPPAALAVETVPYHQDTLLDRLEFLRECLRHLDFRKGGIRLISCPCCARCKVDFQPIAHAVGEAVRNLEKDLDVAVMGCEINGPGEARMADVGVACGKGVGVIFRKGEIVRRVSPDLIVSALLEEIQAMD